MALMTETFRSGDALFACGADLRIALWNAEAERLTGIPAADAVGRPCWAVLRGVDERGGIVCHPGCSGARLALEGWPVPCSRMLIPTGEGRTPVAVSTVAVRFPGSEPAVLHLLRRGAAVPNRNGRASGSRAASPLTSRQQQILRLLAEGLRAKVIATHLGIKEVTVRNHIHAILTALDCHSQLEAVAKARRHRLL